MKCTNTAVAAEEPISKQPSASTDQPSSSAMATPSQQKNVSQDIVPDYAIHLLHCGTSFPVIALVEVKRKEEFKDKSICQTIGYHIASKRLLQYESSRDTNIIPPLLVLICQDMLKFIFLPFVKEVNHHMNHCIDAIVTPSIPIMQTELLISDSWFSFVCYYITGVTECTEKLDLMDAKDYEELDLHPKKTYAELMETPLSKEALESEWQKEREEWQKEREKSEKEREKLEKKLEKLQKEAADLRTCLAQVTQS